ncbi:multidrug effflux MFS transporter [Hoeflea sp. WL0058]|uniref:Bcr/CflA family efflux transporter n=1 Tax=Flavimaribacter sediminis TaxID=2865987 RepID=A0AAE3D059_9HYPH|nr:multidrug effflux MFS transporter [Flavimaribacter sediminis]
MSGFLNRRTPPTIITLVIMAGLGPLNMNIILPALPAIEIHFQTPYVAVQLLISAYLAMTALVQIALGPLSDRYGRRPVMLVSIIITLISTLGCIYAPNFEVLLISRLVQTAVVSGIALSRAVIRDLVEPDEAASMIGYVTMGMAVMPMLGPAVGGYLSELYGWQSTFWVGFVFTLIVLWLVYFDLGETNQHKSSSFRQQIGAYPELFRSRRFWGYSLCAAFTVGAFFAFLGGGPYVATEMLDMSPATLGAYFALTAVGYMVGNFFSGMFARRVGINRMMLIGNMIAASGMLLAFVVFKLGLHHPISFFGCMSFIGLGNGITLPSANAGIVSVRPHLAGSASGLGGAIMVGGGAVLSVVAGSLLGPDTGPYPLIFVIMLSSIAGMVSTLYVIHVDRLVAKENTSA